MPLLCRVKDLHFNSQCRWLKKTSFILCYKIPLTAFKMILCTMSSSFWNLVEVGMSCSGPADPHLPTAAALYSQSFEQPHMNVAQGDKSQLVSTVETIPAGFIWWGEDLTELQGECAQSHQELSAPGSCRASAAATTPPSQEPDVAPEARPFDKENRPTQAAFLAPSCSHSSQDLRDLSSFQELCFWEAAWGMNSER